MRKYLLLVALWPLLGCPTQAQTGIPTFQYVAAAPSGACGTNTVPIQVVVSNGFAYSCNNGTWGAFNSNGAGASGTVTSFGFTNGQGITGAVTNPNTTPVLALTLGNITPTAVNGFQSPPVTTFASSGSTYYVDNISGSNSNSGLSPALAWSTIAFLNSQALASGSVVRFLSDDVWHEQLNAKAGVTYSWYGAERSCTLSSQLVAYCLHMPVIDGADVVAGWTLVTGTTYSSPYTATASKGFVDAQYRQTVPLALQSSLGNVESTPGSIFSNGTVVYVSLLDGSNPTNHTVEVSGSRAYGVELGGLGNITVEGLEIIRSAKSGVVAGANQVGPSVIVRDNVFFNTGDTLGDNANQGLGAGNGEGAIFGLVATNSSPQTGWQIYGNWVGQTDYTDSMANATLAGIMTMGLSGEIVRGNKIAVVHGAALQVSDATNTTCSAPDVEDNEVVNSEGNLNFIGCQNDIILGNSVHDSVGPGIAIGGGIVTGDQNNASPYLANNTIHDLAPAYSNAQFNGINIAQATNGIATGNIVYRVPAGSMTLDVNTGPSSGWQIYGNLFDATQNTAFNGTAPSGSSTAAYPMYVRSTSLTSLVARANTFAFNPTTAIIRFGATSSSDFTHDLSQSVFDAADPGFEIGGPIGNFTSLTATSITDSGLSGGVGNCVQVASGGALSQTGTPCGGTGGGFPITLGTTSIGSGTTTTTIAGLHLTGSTFNGVTLTTGGSTSMFLNANGTYSSVAGFTQTICGGTITFTFSAAIGPGQAGTPVPTTCTGLQGTDNIELDFNGSPLGITGFVPSTGGTLQLFKWPTTNTINVNPVNNTLNSFQPGTFTVNYHVYR